MSVTVARFCSVMGGGDDGDGFNLGALRDGAEVFGEQGLEFGGVEVAGDGDGWRCWACRTAGGSRGCR